MSNWNVAHKEKAEKELRTFLAAINGALEAIIEQNIGENGLTFADYLNTLTDEKLLDLGGTFTIMNDIEVFVMNEIDERKVKETIDKIDKVMKANLN